MNKFITLVFVVILGLPLVACATTEPPYFDSLKDCEAYRGTIMKSEEAPIGYVPSKIAKKEFEGGDGWTFNQPGPTGACLENASVLQGGKGTKKTVLVLPHPDGRTNFWLNQKKDKGIMNFCNNKFARASGDFSPVSDQAVVAEVPPPPPAPVAQTEGSTVVVPITVQPVVTVNPAIQIHPTPPTGGKWFPLDRPVEQSSRSHPAVVVPPAQAEGVLQGNHLPNRSPNCRTDFTGCEAIRDRATKEVVGHICPNQSPQQAWTDEGEMCGITGSRHFRGFKIFTPTPYFKDKEACRRFAAGKMEDIQGWKSAQAR